MGHPVDEFQTNIEFFKENRMHQDVLIRLMKDWKEKDVRNDIFLKEFIKLKHEKEKLISKENHEFKQEKNVANVPETQDQDLKDFLCNINDFNTNKMKPKVFTHLMKKWTTKDEIKIYFLNEFINLRNEIERLHQIAKNALDMSDVNFQCEKTPISKMKKEVKDEIEIISID